MTDVDTTIADLQSQIRALDLDRTYWRDQHDVVMRDWRADIEAWSAARADLATAHDACRLALADLLRFFDPATGAIAARLGRDFLNDAFARAHLAHENAAPQTSGVSPASER